MITKAGLASIVAPMAPTIVVMYVPAILAGHDLYPVFMVSLFSVPFSYLSFLFIGLPIYYLLKSIEILSLGSLILCGLIVGAIEWFVFLKIVEDPLVFGQDTMHVIRVIASGGVFGVLMAMSFGLILGVPIRRK